MKERIIQHFSLLNCLTKDIESRDPKDIETQRHRNPDLNIETQMQLWAIVLVKYNNIMLIL